MSEITAASIPTNFKESVNAKIQLQQPEPQYFFAMLAMASRLSLQAVNAGMDTVQQYVSAMGGGAAVNPDFERLIRAADSGFGASLIVVEDFGKNGGDTVKFQRPLYEGGGYTKDARLVVPAKPTSTVGQNIKSEEVPIILQEYEGPFSAANGEVRPYQILNFDAKFRANSLQLAGLVSLHLRRDFIKWLDAVIRDHFRSSSNVTLPSGVANAAGFVSGGTAGISLEQISLAKKALSDREWQPFPDGRYKCLVPTSFNTQMISDPDWRDLSKLNSDKNMLFRQIASWQDVDFYEVTTLKTYAAGESINASVIGAGVTLNEALLIGPGAVGFGIGYDPKAFFDDNSNYGKSIKTIWRAALAFETLDDRAIQRIVYQG